MEVIVLRKEKLQELINNELVNLPWYVEEYYYAKLSVPYSLATLYEYLKEYRRFFNWLLSEAIVKEEKISLVPLSALENLKKEDVELFKSSLLSRQKLNSSDTNEALSYNTVKRTMASLSSLFNYLTTETEKENGNSYFDRNVMLKVKSVKINETFSSRAAAIKEKLFLGDESMGYLNFIEYDYPKSISLKQLPYYKKSLERDLAINALILGTGLRVSEAANININDLNLATNTVSVIRKGGKKDSVIIVPFAMVYLDNYLNVRTQRYAPEKNEKALFLTTYKKNPKRIETDTIEKMVAKYSTKFKTRVTPHKLRHTLATKLYQVTKNQMTVSNQLGQSSLSATALYIHIIDDEQRDSMNSIE